MHYANHLSSVLHSPFSLNTSKHGLTYTGGKLDDVTVVVSREAQSETSASLLVQEDHVADAFKLAYTKIYIGMSCYQYIPVYTLPGADLPVFYHL